MIADALFTSAQQKLLALLFVQVDKAFHLNEIIRLTGLGSASAQRELKRLDDAGLILSERIGNARLFRPNRNSPVYPELHGLIQKTMGLVGVLRAELQPLSPAQNIAFVFGSIAKGEETADSDVDLMLVGESISYGALLSALAPAEQALGRKISPTFYTHAEFAKRIQEQQHFLMRVLELPKIFILRDSDDLRRIVESGQGPQARDGEVQST
jgi:predicted nucleotidyltransferase/DNA-binding transcriptional ArsR family regulator